MEVSVDIREAVAHYRHYTQVFIFLFIYYFLLYTSSSAVAKRPRDASCPSVVSFNSTKRRVESLLLVT